MMPACGTFDYVAIVPTAAVPRRTPHPGWPVASREPVENAFAESFNGWLRDECLNTQA